MPDAELRLQLHRMTWRRSEDLILVLDLNKSTYLSVNGTGAVIWELLVHGATLETLIKRVTDLFDVEAEIAAADINTFVDELRSRQFME
jgi:hypothetical protein